jgi:rhamnogalacturonyl hydrolase YesR
MSKALIKCQREDGFWNVSLHDPTNYGGPETSGTALFVYGMAWGIRNGILDAKTYEEPMIRAWNAIVEKAVHPNGFLGYMQGTGKILQQANLSLTIVSPTLRTMGSDVYSWPAQSSTSCRHRYSIPNETRHLYIARARSEYHRFR